MRSLGADEVIDYRVEDPRHPAQRYDWILDVNAHDSVLSWRHAVRPGGVYAALGGDSAAWFASALVQGPALSLARRRRMGLVLHWKPFDAADVQAIKALLASGAVTPIIDRSYPFDDLVEALRYVDDGPRQGQGRRHDLSAGAGRSGPDPGP